MGTSPTDPNRPNVDRAADAPPAADQADRTTDPAIRNFSIVVGGPVYDFLVRAGLFRFGLPNLARRIVALIALTWLPLLLLSLKDGLALGHQVEIPLLYDFSMYGRFLLGLPLLLVAEVVIDPSIRRAVAEFVNAGLVPPEEVPRFEEVLNRTQRLRDSALPDLVLLALAFFPVFVFQHEWTGGAVSSWHTTAHGLTPAGWWYATISGPIMKFVTFRWAYRYFIWSILLIRISRLRLILIPTHPDHAAGLGFLSAAQRRFGILFCALGCSVAGRIANSMLFEGAPLASFKLLMAAFVVLSLLVGLLPLTLLAPRLARVRREGLLEYGRLAYRYTESFDRKWVHPTAQPSEALLGTGDIQSLADLGNSFALVDAMRIAPISKRLVLQIAVQAGLPLVPVIILGTPAPELINEVLKMVV
jgi:hypothetical protein